MAKAPYYIILTLQNQVLLSFLNVRVVVNDRDIYTLVHNQPVIIPLEKDSPRIVLTDGYHFSKPLQFKFKRPGYLNFNVVCAISDLQLIKAGCTLAVLYMLGFLTGFFVIKLLSFAPILWLIIAYYINKNNFLRVTRAR